MQTAGLFDKINIYIYIYPNLCIENNNTYNIVIQQGYLPNVNMQRIRNISREKFNYTYLNYH